MKTNISQDAQQLGLEVDQEALDRFKENKDINKYKKKLIKKGIKFCIVEEVSKEWGKPIIRKVTYSSTNGPSLGTEFIGGIKE